MIFPWELEGLLVVEVWECAYETTCGYGCPHNRWNMLIIHLFAALPRSKRAIERSMTTNNEETHELIAMLR